jgi:hypothetical protein
MALPIRDLLRASHPGFLGKLLPRFAFLIISHLAKSLDQVVHRVTWPISNPYLVLPRKKQEKGPTLPRTCFAHDTSRIAQDLFIFFKHHFAHDSSSTACPQGNIR